MYLESNEPFQYVDNGIASGFISGGLGGVLMAGSAHLATSRRATNVMSGFNDRARAAAVSAANAINPRLGNLATRNLIDAEERMISGTHNAVRKGLIGARRQGERFFGTGRRAAATYGASILAGGMLNTLLD